jgi:ABC-type hemin transport system ATPase subunit
MGLRTAFDPGDVTAVVGAGGKKSTLYALAGELTRPVLTATVRIPPFEDRIERVVDTVE